MQAPPKYDGSDDTDRFMEWLKDMIRYIRTQRNVGPNGDESRLDLMGLQLEGPAKEWFDEEVQGPYSTGQWTFLWAVLGLYKRSITQLNPIKAHESYKAYQKAKGQSISSYARGLIRLASQMVQAPSDYEFKWHFLEGLPPTTLALILSFRGLSAERSEFGDLVAAAQWVEERDAVVKAYLQSRGIHPSTNPGGPKLTGRPTAAKPPPKPVIAKKELRFAPRSSSRPPLPQAGAVKEGPKRDFSKMRCHKCQGIGHIQTNPSCPKYEPRVRINNQEVGIEEDTLSDQGDQDAKGADDTDDPPHPPEEDDDMEATRQLQELGYQEDEAGQDPAQTVEEYKNSGDNYWDLYTSAMSGGLFAMTVVAKEPEPLAAARMLKHTKTAAVDSNIYESRLDTAKAVEQPNRRPLRHHPLTLLVKVNGVEAYTLLDSGSNTDAISQEFLAAARIPTFDLANPMALQLGVKSSRAQITRGARVSLDGAGLKTANHYVDIVNIDKYDMILGTPALAEFGIVLDVEHRRIITRGKEIDCLDPVQDESMADNARSRKMRPLKAEDVDPGVRITLPPEFLRKKRAEGTPQ